MASKQPLALLMSAPVPTTRDRIIQAAIQTFARDGLQGATTRVIAQEAGVNEVTLFRHFQSKEGLLAAMMSAIVQKSHQHGLGETAEWSGNLKKNLRRFADEFYASLASDEAFIRTMVGEAKRHPEHAKKLIMDAVKPVRDRFIANLEAARKAGLVRRGIDLGVATDAFTAMLFGGMLRMTAGFDWGYEAEQFVATCVDIFAAGISPAPKP